jgi:hypothetical protein
MSPVKRLVRILLLVVVSTVVLTVSGVVSAGDQTFRALTAGELFKKGPQYTESIDMMFDVTQGGALSLGTTNGSVRINTWSRNQIRLVITKTMNAESPFNARTILEDFLVQARHKGRDLDLQAVAGSESCKNTVGVTFEVWVPQDYNVDINTGSGNVDIGKISGSFSAKTGDGKISFECDPEGMDIEVEDNSSEKGRGSPESDEIEGHKPADAKTGSKIGDAESGKSTEGSL